MAEVESNDNNDKNEVIPMQLGDFLKSTAAGQDFPPTTLRCPPTHAFH